MASTFSELKFELIGTGDQAGNWGDTTNDNIGTAIEQAIAGFSNAQFTSDANLTLTLTDTVALQTARALFLDVTSSLSLTVTRDLVVPSIQKQYIVRNNTTGGQSIVVKTSAGLGVTIPNGETAHLYVNGTDVLDAVTYLTSLDLGTALPITSGGTGQTTRQEAMDALAGAVTSGYYLRGNGTDVVMAAIQAADVPTLNQNTTGTAANVTGTVAIANGGTGQTTAAAAITALTGTQVSGQYLRSDGTNAALSAIQAADVPTLNQNTTGTAANVTGTVAVVNGGTGATDASGARTNLVAAQSGANTDITSIALTTGTISTAPSGATDIVNKSYVDTLAASGIHFHTPVRVESPINLNATYNNGTSGVGATLTNAGTQAALVIDGVTVSVADRVLVYEQTTQTQNGIYVVTDVGSGSTNWILTRSSDADTYVINSAAGLSEGSSVFVQQGTTGAGETYTCNTSGVITFGTTNITFAQISSAQIYSAGTGLTLSGTQFSITNTGTAGTYGDAATVPVITTNAQGQVTSVTNTAIAIPNSATTATSANTASAIVARDASGNFSATTVTANLSGNATNVTGIVAVANGGTGTSTPSLVQGTNITITGTWPNQTINASGGGGTGDVVGPASATNNGIALFDTTTGKLLKNSSTTDGLIQGITVGRGLASVATNTAIGYIALSSNTTGNQNTALGYEALKSTNTGANSTGVGYQALRNQSSGDSNTAVGAAAMPATTSGTSNTAVGAAAMQYNSSGGYNVALGARALNYSFGSNNVAVGYSAGANNQSGQYNTGVGSYALGANEANSNTAVGYTALFTASTGTLNTVLGYRAGYDLTTGSKNTIIGSYSGNQGGLDIRTSSNNIVISDGDGNPRIQVNSSGNVTVPGTLTATNLATLTGTQTLTNKTIDYASNTLTGVTGVTATQTLTNKTITNLVFDGDYTEEVFTITDGASVDLDPSNGTVQLWTLGASRSPTASSFDSGQSMTLMVDDGSDYAITWPSVTWKTDGGDPPTLNTSGYTVVQLWKVSTVLYGARVGDA